MEISFLNKSKSIQPQKVNDSATDPAKKISTEENSKHIAKNQVDSSEISESHSGSFEDKKIMVAKSAILYEVSVNTSAKTIEELKEAIKNGTYDISAEDLAEAILKK